MTGLRFSQWVKWDDRSELEGLEHPGIYALAISRKAISGQRFSFLKNIKYFGMTNSKAGLKGRLSQFNNTLRDKSGGGHGGSDRFRFDYVDGEKLARILYVSVVSFECNARSVHPSDLLVMGRVAMAEYQAFAKYSALFKRLPKYNDKQQSPKHSQR